MMIPISGYEMNLYRLLYCSCAFWSVPRKKWTEQYPKKVEA